MYTHANITDGQRATLTIPLRGLSVRAAKTLAASVFDDLAAASPAVARSCWIVLHVLDSDGVRVARHKRTASGWRQIETDPVSASPCGRCGGHGLESWAGGECFACGRMGPRARAVAQVRS